MGNAQISTTYPVTLETLPMTVNSVNAISERGINYGLQSGSNLQVLSHGLGGSSPLSSPVDGLNRASSNPDNENTSLKRRLKDFFSLKFYSPNRSDINSGGSPNSVNNSAPLDNSKINSGGSPNSVSNSVPEVNKPAQTNNIQAVIPLSPQPTTPPPPENPLIKQVLDLTNVQRQLAGLQPLQLNVQLNKSAQAHSEDMALRDFFSHTGSNGTAIGDRAKAAGYKYSYIGENIGAGQATAQDIVQRWMNSPSHKDQILNPNYREIGVGYFYHANDTGTVNYQHYWTVDFGKAM